MSNYKAEKCKDCEHWEKVPTDPTNVGQALGECRESLKLVFAYGPRGGGLVSSFALVEPEHPACSHFSERQKAPGKFFLPGEEP